MRYLHLRLAIIIEFVMGRRKKVKRHPAHPRYWLLWLGFALFALLGQLPWRVLLAIGRALGRISWHLAPKRRHITRVNMDLCFPEKSAAEREQLARASVESAGMGLMEMAGTYFNRYTQLPRRLEVEGKEHLLKALAENRGVLMLGTHFTTLEVAGRLFSSLTAYDAVYRPNDNPALDLMIRRGRGSHTDSYIDRRDLRTLVRRLRQGKVVWYAPDQDYGMKHSIFAPFFGQPAATITATSRIARLARCPVVPISYYRLSGGRYRMVFDAPLENFPSGDDQADAATVNQAVEKAVRRAPEQYLWVHRRFKHQPDGSNPYR